MSLKKSLFGAAISFGLVCAVHSPALANQEKLMVDSSQSYVAWLGKKLTGQHNGKVSVSNGEIMMKDGKIVSGSFDIAMNTIANEDIESPKWRAKLENHLKSDDFFNITKFPLGKFTISSVLYPSEGDSNMVTINGTLNVKGIEKQLSFPAKIEKKGDMYVGTADLTIDRTKWDIKYNSGSYFDPQNLGDKLIYDNVGITLNIVAKEA